MTAKDLKNALLQEAVMGKLVPQIASEGNARDLLDEIKKAKGGGEGLPLAPERKRSSATPSAGTPRNAPRISDEEVPFDIPESWCWCRLGEITTILGDGIHGTPEYDINGEYYFVNGNNLSNGKIEIKPDTKKVNLIEYEKYKKQLNENTVLVSINGTLGNLAFYNNEKIILGKSACYFNLVLKEMKNYVFYILKTKYFNDYAEAEATKTTIRNVSLGAMRNLLIPLPPLAEQKRIVAAIEKFMPLIEEYGKKESALNLLNTQIASLTKKAILQEAVQGRLVPQIATEGNAKDLLKEIKKSHTDLQISTKSAGAKSDLRSKSQIRVTKKELPPITQEEIPFDIPESWCWCRLSDLCNMYTGDSINETEKKLKYTNISDGWNYIGTKDVGFDQQITYDNGVKIPYSNTDFRIAPKDTVLMCIEGGSAGRKIAYTNQDVCFGNKLCCFNPFIKDIEPFLYFYLQSTLFTDAFKDNLTGIISGVSINTLKTMYFPLPPLAEQKRIVSAIEKLLSLCKKLGQ